MIDLASDPELASGRGPEAPNIKKVLFALVVDADKMSAQPHTYDFLVRKMSSVLDNDVQMTVVLGRAPFKFHVESICGCRRGGAGRSRT